VKNNLIRGAVLCEILFKFFESIHRIRSRKSTFFQVYLR
jgi:hypothetical protein